jgi:hypothetical protein
MILHFAGDSSAAGSPMQSMPNLKQDTFTVAPPLTIPKSQHFDPLTSEQFFTGEIVFKLDGRAVHKPIEFDGESRQWAIEIEVLPGSRMLASEFETRKTTGPQSLPELLLLRSLIMAEAPGISCTIHVGHSRSVPVENKQLSWPAGNERTDPSPQPSPLLKGRGRAAHRSCIIHPRSPH